jgi:hypothetical protein
MEKKFEFKKYVDYKVYSVTTIKKGMDSVYCLPLRTKQR